MLRWPPRRAKTFDLDAFPVKIPPILRAIDNSHRLDNKAYLAEIQVEQGKLLLCSLNVLHDFVKEPEVPYLFDQLVRYGLGKEFAPSARYTSQDFDALLAAGAKGVAGRTGAAGGLER